MREILKSLARWICRRAKLLPVDTRGGAIEVRRLVRHWTREDLVEALVECMMGGHGVDDFFTPYLLADRERERLESLLRSRYHTDKDLNRALHMADLEEKNRRLKEQVRRMQVKAEKFNNKLYATGLIVNCTGCEAGKPFDGENLTEARVQEVERIAKRLRSWFENHKYRQQRQLETAGVR